MRYASDLAKLKAICSERGITPFKLAKETGTNQTKMYEFFRENGRPMSEEICIRIAEAESIKLPVAEVFPTMVDKTDPDAEIDATADQGLDDSGKKVRLVVNDMIVGCQESCPPDGVTLKVHRVVNCDGMEFPGYQLNPDEQVIIRTGVSARGIDFRKVSLRLKQKLIERHNLSNLPYFIVKDHELCAVVHSYGLPVMMTKGMEFAEIIF